MGKHILAAVELVRIHRNYLVLSPDYEQDHTNAGLSQICMYGMMTPIRYIWWDFMCFVGLLTHWNRIKMHRGEFFKLQRKYERSLQKALHYKASPALVKLSESAVPLRMSQAPAPERTGAQREVIQQVSKDVLLPWLSYSNSALPCSFIPLSMPRAVRDCAELRLHLPKREGACCGSHQCFRWCGSTEEMMKLQTGALKKPNARTRD